MSIICIGCEKGGTGKTTFATNLAACRAKENKDVLIVDTDPQGSASFWAGIRDEEGIVPKIFSIQKIGKGFASQIKDLANRYDEIIIDAGGRDSSELREALTISEKVIIPLQSSQYDIWTITKMDELISSAKVFNPSLRAYVALNRSSNNPHVKESQEAAEIINEFDNLNLYPHDIKDRIVYRKTASQGKGVTEAVPLDPKAAKEIESLNNFIYGD